MQRLYSRSLSLSLFEYLLQLIDVVDGPTQPPRSPGTQTTYSKTRSNPVHLSHLSSPLPGHRPNRPKHPARRTRPPRRSPRWSRWALRWPGARARWVGGLGTMGGGGEVGWIGLVTRGLSWSTSKSFHGFLHGRTFKSEWLLVATSILGCTISHPPPPQHNGASCRKRPINRKIRCTRRTREGSGCMWTSSPGRRVPGVGHLRCWIGLKQLCCFPRWSCKGTRQEVNILTTNHHWIAPRLGLGAPNWS